MNRDPVLWLIGLATVLCSSGATCVRSVRPAYPPAPVTFAAPPTLEDAIYAVNANTGRVRSLQSDSVSLSTPGCPSLRANISLEGLRRFRLRGSFLGPELDVGSNDELFWLWAKSNPEPVIYYARHDQFRDQHSNFPFLVQPECLVEAFGLVYLQPAGIHEGPFPRGNGRIEIRSRAGETGQYVRTMILDETYGWVLEQSLADERGQILVSSRTSGHRYYPTENVNLPHHVEMHFPPANMSFVIDIGQFSINQIAGDSGPLWSMPQIEGYQPVNLAEMSASGGQSPWHGGSTSPGMGYAERPFTTSYRPRYRGYSARR